MLRLTQGKQAARSRCRGEVWIFLSISYLMLPVGQCQWGPWSRYKRVGLLIGFPGQRTWPHRPWTLVEQVAAIVPGEPEPWPGFRGIGGSGAPNI